MSPSQIGFPRPPSLKLLPTPPAPPHQVISVPLAFFIFYKQHLPLPKGVLFVIVGVSSSQCGPRASWFSITSGYNCTFSGFFLDLWNQTSWGQGPELCVLTNPPGDSLENESLRTTGLQWLLLFFPPPPTPICKSKKMEAHLTCSAPCYQHQTHSRHSVVVEWWPIDLVPWVLCLRSHMGEV